MQESDEACLLGEAFSTETTLVATNPGFLNRAPILDYLRERTKSASRIAPFGLGGVG
jgi:hypothetical protein